MYIIRPITEKDAEDFVSIAFHAGIGMTSMPKNREVLLELVANSINAFNKEIHSPGRERYLFLLENTDTGEIVGTCGIAAKTGLLRPLYFYRVETHYKNPSFISTPQKIPIMRVVRYDRAPTEICSLFLLHKARVGGLGKLLSLSRFLFIATHPSRFDKIIYAEMRGYIDSNNISPFWEGFGRHFVDIKFEELMHIRDMESIDVSQALPAHPIYLNLLPKEVKESIGKVHSATVPALQMLIQEGFSLTEEVDVFDGGPKIEAETKEIATIKQSKISKISEIVDKFSEEEHHLISNERLSGFRACLGTVKVKDDHSVILDKETAHALQVEIGNFIRYK